MSSIHNLRNEVEKMKRKMNRMEREREQLMEINKKRRWEKSNTFEWAREAWATINNDDDDASVDETDALSPDLSEYTQMDLVDKSLVALRDIERRALESCDGIQQTKTKESSEKSQDTEKLILEHSNALLRAMRVKKPEILEMQGKRVSSSSTSKRHAKKKNSDKMTASQREAFLSVTGSSKRADRGGRRQRSQRAVRNYNIRDENASK